MECLRSWYPHLSVLLETMRREGYELQVGKPQVIYKEVDGAKHEPFEHLVIDVPEESAGKATELVMMRKGMLQVMEPKGDLQHMEFRIPSRGLIGLRNQIPTATSGEAIMTHRFESYDAYAGDISTRSTGSLVSSELVKQGRMKSTDSKKEELSLLFQVMKFTQAK